MASPFSVEPFVPRAEWEDDRKSYAEIDYTPLVPRHDPPPLQPSGTAHFSAQAEKAKQKGLGFDGEVLKETVIRKLLTAGFPAFAAPLQECHTRQVVKLCTGCYTPKVFYNRCENFYCPCCARRLSNDRRKSVEFWTAKIRQPKHVVLTAKNTEDFTPAVVRRFKEAWSKLRRRAFAKNWSGGFYSLEVTNEGKGWHLHLHALIDAPWIDAGRLAKQWAECIGQDFAIVKVKDCRSGDYLRELCKYIVDGNMLAGWTGEQIGTYVLALRGQRTFGVFGTLYKLRSEHRTFLDEVQADAPACECGCTTWRYFSESEWEWFESVNGPNGNRCKAVAPRTSKNHITAEQASLL